MKLNSNEINVLDKIFRVNLINSITGIKPANLIGTKSKKGLSNLAIFTSVFHMGSNPPLIGMLVRPDKDVRRHTLENIKNTGFYTINHVHESSIIKSHYTSAKFDPDESEFERCHFTEQYIDDFKAPFVKECTIKIGLKFQEEIPIHMNNTILVIGCIELLIVDKECIEENGYIDLEKAASVGVSGLNSYYSISKRMDLPYARVDDLPDYLSM